MIIGPSVESQALPSPVPPVSHIPETRRRRTFAIISHPDAGKTTLTEKLLLFSGAIQIAGAVKGRKASRHATSDWMEIEKQRGISVASSVMQMSYRDHVVNLLDTPGHKDFSEDTYRVLTAVGVLAEVLVAGRVEQVDHVVAVGHLHHARRDRDAALLFDLHPVAGGVAAGLAALDGAGDLDRA